MRLATFIFTSLLGLRAEAASVDLAGWIGKYSHDTDTNGHTLFQVPSVHAALNRLLTKQQLKQLTEIHAVSSKITSMQGFLVVPQCLPRCCPCEHSLLVVDINRGEYHVGFYKREAEKVSIQWISSEGEFASLPKAVRDEF